MRNQHGHPPVDLQKTLQRTKQNCLHAEPNYGVLWFYYKDSLIDNAFDVWHNAEREIAREFSPARDRNQISWLASTALTKMLTNSTRIGSSSRDCTFDQKIKIVYGFE